MLVSSGRHAAIQSCKVVVEAMETVGIGIFGVETG